MTTVSKNEYYTKTVTDYTHEGMGVIKVEHYPIFVPDVLVGEEIEVKVLKANKKFGFGKLINVIEPAKNRIEPPCPYYFQCGGCQIQTLDYTEQRVFKKGTMDKSINRMAQLNQTVNDTIGMETPMYYRNKSQIPVKFNDGKVEMGFYKPRSHDIVDIHHCLIQKEIHNDLMVFIKELLNDEKVSIYDEAKHQGLLRHVIIRSNNDDSEVQIAFVTNGRKNVFGGINQAITEHFPMVTSIVQNVNTEKTNVIFGNKTNILYGQDYITDTLLGKKFRIRARSFYQVNHEQTEKLYKEALEAADLKGDETIIDTYCGIGTIGLCASDKAERIIGIEVVDSAVEDAKENAELNGVENADYHLGKSEEVMKKLVSQGVKPDVVFVDPPRKGCHPEFLEALAEVKPQKIIYVSCNPSTLQRDLKYLNAQGYDVSPVTPVDMFPQTNHVEGVVALELMK
ncbi:23S rRNA (uracil(1939)-C(5))-methyltransferase RlmD [Salinicoccus halodurans]|uniref:23S rRNA m(5)U-1939 methyltransferase n=1 Tax=Salinicoccus halodurans TaxID=407035 RepID=A0A0F7HM47_9STAP|nr:23S rRNA (uracil(1939)-C(5))-methyltransferase RlmD [Salinicoccus halodurans]AKG74524.1 RNA methyltransferase [Salinicoccus halodurans]SFK90274.1 23S rRNA m(5)U-1939 methyltransferase [Salinicoccus halodurans]